jgi:hypothetical protein
MLLVVADDSADAVVMALVWTVIIVLVMRLEELMMVLPRPDVLRCCGWWGRCWCRRFAAADGADSTAAGGCIDPAARVLLPPLVIIVLMPHVRLLVIMRMLPLLSRMLVIMLPCVVQMRPQISCRRWWSC